MKKWVSFLLVNEEGGKADIINMHSTTVRVNTAGVIEYFIIISTNS
jgi:hypothetical protein